MIGRYTGCTERNWSIAHEFADFLLPELATGFMVSISNAAAHRPSVWIVASNRTVCSWFVLSRPRPHRVKHAHPTPNEACGRLTSHDPKHARGHPTMQYHTLVTGMLAGSLIVGAVASANDTADSKRGDDVSLMPEAPPIEAPEKVGPTFGLASAPTGLATTVVATGLVRPTTITHAPGDDTRLFITERAGRIRIVDLNSNQTLPTPFLDISSIVNVGTQFGDERGLLGLAFHPDYDDNGYFYVYYIGGSGSGFSVIRRYSVSAENPNIADAGSALTLLTFTQPFTNHNGGWIAFGPDGYLYIASGDGGNSADPNNNGQNPNNLLGAMLRIDVDNTDGGLNYAIPDDNPYKGVAGFRDEIWSYGLRNPWRNSFDRLTGDLWIADVGQWTWEEVNIQPASSAGGENWGWRCYEGFSTFNTTGCPHPNLLHFPVYAYPISGQSECAVTGGYVYRGCDIPDLYGTYIFGDFCSAQIWAVDPNDPNLPYNPSQGGTNPVVSIRSQLSPSVEGLTISWISTFGEDARGELYIADFNVGRIFKIIHQDGPQANPDLNCDGVVDGADLLILLSAWGKCADPDNCPADLNDDGTVDGADLLILLAAWG
jgi:glucose/arabinose dehydrogenase